MTWAPLSVFVALFGSGVLLVEVDLGLSGAQLVLGGVIDGTQLGVLLMIPGQAAGVAALIQVIVLVGRLRSRLLALLVRIVSALVLMLALPVGSALLWMAAFSTVNSYRPLDVAGHSVVVRRLSWHHTSYSILEGDGFLYRSVMTCGGALLAVDTYDPFASGEYEVISRGGRDVLMFPEDARRPCRGAVILGQGRNEDVSGLCVSLPGSG